jgi:aspartate ammonia-lyase
MNVNEVLANLAEERLGGERGRYTLVHPNDHVNMGQSTNDVFPSATRLALLMAHQPLLEVVRALQEALASKASAFGDILKVGRTHLQDAVPMTLGQEFGGWAACLDASGDQLAHAAGALLELNVGATAVGTGLNAGEEFAARVVSFLADATGLRLRTPVNRFRVTQSMGDVVAYVGALRRLAVELSKIANDLRLLSMGPRAGLSETRLPPAQPGSSIMPGKVNPSIPEMVNQVCLQVIGCDATVAAAGEAGQLELNVMMPVIAWNALHASTILRQAMLALRTRCVEGIEADRARCMELLQRSTAVATALSPYLGYERTAEIAKTAVLTGRPIADIVAELRLLPAATLERVLSLAAMTEPGVPGKGQ